MRRFSNLGWLGAFALLISARAQADDSHYQNFVLGERAAGMGGAYTAIADDPSATYYNPAGLLAAKSGTLNASLSVYGFQQQSLESAFQSSASNLFTNVQNSVSSAFQQLNVVPGMAGTVYGLGAPDATGHYRQVLSLSVLVPDDTSSYSINYLVDQQGNLNSVSETDSDETILAALGYAVAISPAFGLGFSFNGLYRNLTRTYRTITAADESPGPSTSFFEDDLTLRAIVVGLYVQSGIMWHVLPALTVGLTVASPSLTIYSTGSTDQVLVNAAGLSETFQQNLNADTRWPAHGRLGVAYELLDHRLLLAADFSLWGATSYQLLQGSTFAQNLPTYVNSVRREVTWNVDLGAQYRIANKYELRGGFFTNNSSAPNIDACNTTTLAGCEPQLDNINLYGFTLGVMLPSRFNETTIGTSFSIGNGQSKTATANTAQSTLVYQSEPSTQFYFDIFLGGSYRF